MRNWKSLDRGEESLGRALVLPHQQEIADGPFIQCIGNNRDLANAVELSPSYFHRLFKGVTGVTPKNYAAAHRAARVREGLEKCHTVTKAIYDAGFYSSGRFYEKVADMLGMTPSQYRAGGANEEIKFAVGHRQFIGRDDVRMHPFRLLLQLGEHLFGVGLVAAAGLNNPDGSLVVPVLGEVLRVPGLEVCPALAVQQRGNTDRRPGRPAEWRFQRVLCFAVGVDEQLADSSFW